jgi:hypothetical protein
MAALSRYKAFLLCFVQLLFVIWVLGVVIVPVIVLVPGLGQMLLLPIVFVSGTVGIRGKA